MTLEYQITATSRKGQSEETARNSLNEICTQLENEGFDVTYKLLNQWES